MVFSVRDTGPGIALEDQRRVFDRYWQSSDGARSRGTGLGLSIAKGIVEAHGGRIWVESTPGTGKHVLVLDSRRAGDSRRSDGGSHGPHTLDRHSPSSPRDAVALLGAHHVGRIAFTFHDRVDIEPISYVYADGSIYGRTSPGTKLATVRHHPWVAFEVDEVEGRVRLGERRRARHALLFCAAAERAGSRGVRRALSRCFARWIPRC